MKPIDPGSDFGGLIRVAEGQDEYETLVARASNPPQGITLTTRWQFSDEERLAIAAGADLMLSVLTFGAPLQPLALSVAGVETLPRDMTYEVPPNAPTPRAG